MEVMNIAVCQIISQPYNNLLQYVIIGVGCVAVGAIIDLFLAEDEIGRIHAKFSKLAERLRETPLRQWQIRIAEYGTNSLLGSYKGIITFLGILTGVGQNLSNKLGVPRWIFIVLFASIFTWFIPTLYLISHWWLLGVVAFPFVLMSCAVVTFPFCGLSAKLNKLSEAIYTVIVAITIISVSVSLIAILFTRYFIPDSLLSTHWFANVNGDIAPTSPFLLPLINLPFDFSTIYITISLLRYVVRKKKYIGLVALADIAISGALTILLHCLLRIIENGWDIGNTHVYFVEVMRWFGNVGKVFLAWITNRQSSVKITDMRDIHLLPILLTTFVPVTIYMSIFLFLSFCKGVMLTAARLFHAVGSKKESVFKQFGAVIAALAVLIKAIYDYLVTL